MKQMLVSGFVFAVTLFAGCFGQEEDNSVITRDANNTEYTRFCIVQTLLNDRVISVMSIGQVPSDDAAKFEAGRLWRRPSRFRAAVLRGDDHGRGSATVLAALCEICRKKNNTQCLRRFCSVRRRTRRLKIEVDCV